MKEKTLFIKFLGDSPKIRVLNMLITGRDLEYCISDIAEQAGIARTTFYRMLDQMLKDSTIVPTKKVGKVQLYKLNLKNEKVKELVGLYDKLISEESEKEIERQKKSNLIEA